MTNTEGADALTKVQAATVAEDIFGPVTTDPAGTRKVKRLYRQLAFLLHPDHDNGLDHADASDAFAKLGEFHRLWTTATTSTSTPATAPQANNKITLTTRRGTYVLGDPVGTGTVATLFAGESINGPVVVKMPRTPASSRFIENERAAYKALGAMLVQPEQDWLIPYYPMLLDTATHRATDTREQRKVNILNSFTAADGWYSLADVRKAYPNGLDGRSYAWMHRRLLRAVGGAHLAGLVHGAVLPENVLIHPQFHGVVLAGWSFAAPIGGTLLGRVGSQTFHYPPEAEAGPVTPAVDVYMAHALMIHMLSGGAGQNPERRQRAFARGCMQDSPGMRPSIGSLLVEYDDLLADLYGKRTFTPFHMPATAGAN